MPSELNHMIAIVRFDPVMSSPAGIEPLISTDPSHMIKKQCDSIRSYPAPPSL